MNDKAALLGQLKIDRDGTIGAPSKPVWPWIAGIIAVVAVIGLAIWLLKPAAALKVDLATVQAPAGSNGGSVLDASGYVVARRQATVSSKVTGKVMDILIEEGQRVKAGQVLARIDDSNTRTQLALAQSQFDAAKAQLAEVRVQLEDAERTLVRNRDLAAKSLVSQAQLDTSQANVDALKARLASTQSNVVVSERSVQVQSQVMDDAIVRAPFDGVITLKNAQPGEMISPLSAGGAGTRTGIGTLVDMESLEIEVDVNENFINRVQAGAPAKARLNAYPDWEIPAEVIAVIPTADRSKATVKVRVKFQQLDARILPDMGVRVAFMAEQKTGADAPKPIKGVLVPAEAVVNDGGATYVYVVASNKAERRSISSGGNHGREIIVLDGLKAGEQVAVGDLSKLSDGAEVTTGGDAE